MIRRVLFVMAIGGMVALVACTSEVAAEKYPSVAAFCDGKAAAECSKDIADSCAVTDGVCKGKRADACKAAAGVATGTGRTYKPAFAEACIQKTTELYTGSRLIDATKETAFKDACERVFAGAKKRSEPCSAAFECEGTLICDTDKGFCADKVDKKLDDPCNDPGAICGTGLYCQLRGTIRFCGGKKKVDEPCAADAPCLEDLRCVAGKCAPKVAIPNACETKADCVSGACDANKCIARAYATETSTCKDFGAGG